MHITTRYRKGKGKCEECGTDKRLEAAHIRGKECPLIISNILSEFIENDIIKVDLDEFEERFVAAHLPVENVIRILCTDCHREYDSKATVHEYIPERNNDSGETIKEENTESKTLEILINETLSKSDAIDIVNKKTAAKLNSSNTLFSNINSAIDIWWLQPGNDKFKTGFHFLLNHPDSHTLFHFFLPGHTIINPKTIFSQRNDKDASKIDIPKSTTKFVDRKGFDFGKYLVEKINYQIIIQGDAT